MSLFDFHGLKVGFWLADNPMNAREEIPEGSDITEDREPFTGGESLILSAGTPEGVPVWTRLIHSEKGAALVCPWQENLLVGLGDLAVFLDGEGKEQGRVSLPGGELVSAWPLPEGLLLVARDSLRLIDETLKPRWAIGLSGDAAPEGLMFLEAAEGKARLAALGGDGWLELSVDLQTGEAEAVSGS